MFALNRTIFLLGVIFVLLVVLVYIRYQREGMESVYTKKAAIDYPSNKSTASSATTIAKCKTECDALLTCTGYIFKNPSSCTLKSGELIQPKENEWTDAYIKTPQGAPSTETSVSSAAAVPAAAATAAVANAATNAVLPAAVAASTNPAALPYDTFYVGPIKFPSTAEACQLECDKTSTCAGTVVMNKGANTGWCYLKSATEVPEGNGPVYVGRSKNPYKTPPPKATSDEFYISRTIENVKSIETCQAECDKNKDCTGIFYSMVNTNGYCTLKYKTDPGGEHSIRVSETMGKSTAAAKPPAVKAPGPPPIVQYSATQS